MAKTAKRKSKPRPRRPAPIDPNAPVIYNLCPEFNIQIKVVDGGAVLSGSLDTFTGKDQDTMGAALDGAERLLCALACAGINVASPGFKTALRTAVDAIGNYYS